MAHVPGQSMPVVVLAVCCTNTDIPASPCLLQGSTQKSQQSSTRDVALHSTHTVHQGREARRDYRQVTSNFIGSSYPGKECDFPFMDRTLSLHIHGQMSNDVALSQVYIE